ncbi:cell division protein ZapE [Alteromonas sp. W364]|uniref:cell division protein ZapE n=1 Tax=Alteromonas sp. W364 TaxID=3075610 RepID=UPI002886C98B|nr:cell division protein ZapE [Alteromonas sp. W364]MDT0628717.1 cell division protein ZapE [Alteromonas sp. W364]
MIKKMMIKAMIAQRHVARRCFSKGPVAAAYELKVDAGEARRDEAQVALAAKFDALHESLASLPPVPVCTYDPTKSSCSLLLLLARSLASAQSFLRKKFHLWLFGPPPRGMYIHGPVGVGKSFLMDLFYASVTVPDDDSCCNNDSHKHAKITKRRVHFHEFMLDVHHRIFVYKQKHPRGDAIPVVAQQLAQEAQLLCFDEFQVTEIADAMILKRLFSLLISDWNVVMVATSNRAPDALYERGINRSLFLPFIDLLRQTSDVISMEDSQNDYRLENRADGQSYFWSNKGVHGDNNINHNLQAKLEKIFGGAVSGIASGTEGESIPVLFGRTVQVARLNDRCAWFDFSDLCYQPLGAADYISLCRRFPVIIMECVPQLDANHLNEARRFVTLIDACYESRTRLVLTAQVPLDELFVDFEAQVESSDGDEELIVNDKGGNSSSFATTMIRTKEGKYYEWSATGLIGVSLAQLSAANDLAFSFRRAASRLVEMGGKEWGRQ